MSELLRDLMSEDADVRDDATEELGRRLRGESGRRLSPYLQAIGTPADPDAASRLRRLVEVRNRIDHADILDSRLRDRREESKKVERRVVAWERYVEQAEPGTSSGTWVVENLGAVERLIGALRARLNRIDEEKRLLELEMIGEAERLAELPGAESAP
jgi:hypothetical protein